MGSKSRIAKYIAPIIQKYIDERNCVQYIEPFVGGANIIDKIVCKEKIGNDLRESLIALLCHVQLHIELPSSISKNMYDTVRNYPDGFENWYVGCVGFLASYNGRYFDGGYAKTGYEKVNGGERLRDYYREAKDNLVSQSENKLFEDIIFQCADYRNCLDVYRPNGAVIYCDPPYENTKQYSNSSKFNYDEFWDIMRNLSMDNIVLISGLDAPSDFECVWEQEVSRSIKSTDKGKAVEKLFRLSDIY